MHIPRVATPLCILFQALDYAEQLFEKADLNQDNKLTLNELRAVLNSVSQSIWRHL